MIEVEVNQAKQQVADGTTLADLLTAIGAHRDGVAVAVDGEVVGRSQWHELVLVDGGTVEVLTAVQGG